MMKFLNSTALGMMVLMGGLSVANTAAAENVTLVSDDGAVNVSGEFVEFLDNSYVIQTALGQLRISGERVTCTGADCPVFGNADVDIAIGGSDTVGLGLMPLLLEGYAGAMGAATSVETLPNSNDIIAGIIAAEGFGDQMAAIRVSSTGSSEAFSKLLNNDVEVGMASRRIRPAEARALANAGGGNMISPAQEHIIAVDSLILVTHPSNPIKSLTIEQLRQIYTGQITNWSEVGGPDLAITPVSRGEDSGTRAVFESRIFGSDVPPMAANVIIADTNEAASDLANGNEGVISFVGYAFQRGANALTLVNECGIAMTPDAFSARTEEYALQRRLYLYTREDTLSDKTKSLIDYSTSIAADGVISKAGFIGLAVDRREQTMDSARARALLDPNAADYESNFMRQMLGQMVDYDRLSTTFRFRTGSSQLDERGRIDKARLLEYLSTQPEGTEILIVGFTDDVGEFEGNLNLSNRRAQQIADELIATGASQLNGVTVSARGFGELAPSSCNTTEEGRQINRRVEVWIKSPI